MTNWPESYLKVRLETSSKQTVSFVKPSRLMYGETIAVCSEIHIKYINRLCGENEEFLVLNLPVNKTNKKDYH